MYMYYNYVLQSVGIHACICQGFIQDFFASGGKMIELQLVNFNDILEVYKEKNRPIPL